MKPLARMAVALRECKRCGNLVVVRYGVQDEHKGGGRLCEPQGRQRARLERLLSRLSTPRSAAPRTIVPNPSSPTAPERQARGICQIDWSVRDAAASTPTAAPDADRPRAHT